MSRISFGGDIPDEDVGLRYRLRFLVKHPTDKLEDFSSALELTPKLYLKSGDERMSPSGSPVSGLQRESIWSWWVDVENHRYFSEQVADAVDALEKGKECIQRIVSTDGSAVLILEFHGGRNIGDVIGLKQLAKLVEMQVQLGVEVFSD